MYALDDDDDAEPQWRMPEGCDAVCPACGRPHCEDPEREDLCPACYVEFGEPRRLDWNERVEP